MKHKSHQHLGSHLAKRYMPHISPTQREAFLLGCVQPDSNPFTYFKGSIRCRFLHGHNFCSSRHYIHRLCKQLQHRRHWTVYDYYRLGKLLHYLADAFTYAHNDHFVGSLLLHRQYEQLLQKRFLNCSLEQNTGEEPPCGDFGDYLDRIHRHYRTQSPSVDNDIHYIHTVCCCAMKHLANRYD